MSALAFTVLGCSGTHPGRGRMCSGYLVESGSYRLMLDCGNGSLANLQRKVDVADVDALLLSHLHPDHFADLYGLYYALRFHRDGPRSVPVYAPAGAQEFIGQLLPEESRATFGEHCRFAEVAAGDRLDLGPFHVGLYEANHPIEALALRVTDGGRVLAYSGDSAPSPEIVRCADGADLFACDSTWLERDGPFPDGVHMTGGQAGAQAAAAGVGRLLVTHVLPGNDPAEVAAEASRAFDGPVIPADDLQEYVL